MTVEPESLETLLAAREQLIGLVQAHAAKPGARRFLTRFLALEPDWQAVDLDPALADLPAVRWKLLNLARLKDANGAKFEEQRLLLEQVLDAAR